ncbi:MAG: DNA-processing protein DprA [Lachnospiraceae bacterium]|nr:DNA-processing protein DprA [Lachnospiraceae bacterium]
MELENIRFSILEEGVDSARKHLWLNTIPGVNIKYILDLKNELGNIWNIYDAGENALKNIVPESLANSIIMSKKSSKICEEYDRLLEHGIELLYPERECYPEKLRKIHTPPQLLYVKGRIKNCLNECNKTIGIVGSRNPSSYGREICRYFGEELSGAGFNIISGMARGIDGIAHRAALDRNGYTVAVLGSGINVAYPRSNLELYMQIQEQGAIISEYGLDVSPHPGQFPMRNRIISGLSDSVLVVEARAQSGSLITADQAAEQGRIVYSVPGRIMDPYSEGTNNLIRDGAICVTKPMDIIEDMVGLKEERVGESRDYVHTPSIQPLYKKSDLSEEEQRVLDILSLEPVYIDDIIQKTRMGVTRIISLLYGMEMKKLIKQTEKGYYILRL